METIANKIINLSGGKDNILNVMNCMTRLRIDICNPEIVDIVALENELEDVIKVIFQQQQLQIVMKPGIANKYSMAINKILHFENNKVNNDLLSNPEKKSDKSSGWKDNKEFVQEKNKLPFNGGLRKITNIFVPLIPALIAAGFIGGMANVIQNYYTAHGITNNLPLYYNILHLISKGFLDYFLIFVGFNAAKEFGGTPVLGGMIGGLNVLLGSDQHTMSLLNIHNNTGGVFGVLFASYLLTIIEKLFNKVIPNILKALLVPTFSILTIGTLIVFLIIPLDNILSNFILVSINWLLTQNAIIVGYILSSVFLLLVMLGLHQILIPIYFQQIHNVGYSTLFPILAMAGAGQVGAACAVYLMYKDKQLRKIVYTALPVGILGIGEPLIYGVMLPLGRPFITACLGAGLGGAYIAYNHVSVLAIGPSGIALLPLINQNFSAYILGLLISYIGGFCLTILFGKSTNNKKFNLKL